MESANKENSRSSTSEIDLAIVHAFLCLVTVCNAEVLHTHTHIFSKGVAL